jgi:hypothetical protein
MASGAAAAAAAAAQIANAVKASGAIVRVEPADFLKILDRNPAPLVVTAPGGFFGGRHQYLTSYKGLIFFTQAGQPLPLPAHSETVAARKIWIPA